MTRRILIPCGTDDDPRRHRWHWRLHYHSTPQHKVWDRQCQNCGRWYIDVLD